MHLFHVSSQIASLTAKASPMVATAVKGFDDHSRALILSLKSPFLPEFFKRKIWKSGGKISLLLHRKSAVGTIDIEAGIINTSTGPEINVCKT